MKLNNMNYEQFYQERMSWQVQQTTPLHFTKKEIVWALLQMKACVFDDIGYYEQNKIALDILLWCAQEVLNGRNK